MFSSASSQASVGRSLVGLETPCLGSGTVVVPVPALHHGNLIELETIAVR
jgi:hypothetical protein